MVHGPWYDPYPLCYYLFIYIKDVRVLIYGSKKVKEWI